MNARRWLGTVAVTVSALAIGSSAMAQGVGTSRPSPAQDDSQRANNPKSIEMARGQAAAVETAQTILAREESASGRTFDPAYRAEALRQLVGRAQTDLGQIAMTPGGLGNIYASSGSDLVFVPITPCRVIDTRGGSPIPAGSTLSFTIAGSCGIPFGPATAVAMNLVAVAVFGSGDLRMTPYGTAMPLASVLNYNNGDNIANGIDAKICNPATTTCTFDITYQADYSPTHLVVDVYGYYERLPPAGRAAAVVLRTPSVAFDVARTRNFSTVTHPSTGAYCLTPAAAAGVDLSTNQVLVTPEWDNSLGFTLAAYHVKANDGPNPSTCPAGTLEVLTYDFSSNLSNNVSFEVLVP